MIISAISDIHSPENRGQLNQAIARMQDSDVIIIAGDISSNPKQYQRVLKKFRGLKARKLAVLGNHDLYVQKGKDSFQKARLLERICKEQDFHLLDTSPLIHQGTAFVGNMGWYDYTFAPRIKSEPFQVLGRGSRTLDTMTDEDFAVKCFSFNGTPVSWADRYHIHTQFSDKEILEHTAHKLQADIKAVEEKADKIVYVTHHVPIPQFVYDGDILWKVFNAYQGSPELGKVAFSSPKLRAVICGHSHIKGYTKIKDVECFDVSREFGDLEATDIKI